MSVQVRMQVLPLSAAWWLYVVSGVTALRYLNVPMYRWDFLHDPMALTRLLYMIPMFFRLDLS